MTANAWKAPKGERLPDFIICGAMKCGTSTVHRILNDHPKVSIPDLEIHFFDIDDHLEHSGFSYPLRDRWIFPDMKQHHRDYWHWYATFFRTFPAENIVGEDSTGYIASTNALHRISIQDKPIKLIVCLRHPTERAYSQYWHMLRTGRAMFSFNDTIRFTPHYVLSRSLYLQQIKTLFQHIDPSRVCFFILEDFLKNKKAAVNRLANFVGIDPSDFPECAYEEHVNKGTVPKHVGLEILKCRMLRGLGNTEYIDNFPHSICLPMNARMCRQFNLLWRKINPQIDRPPPLMDSKTRTFLDAYFQRELKGLDEQIGAPVMDLWFNHRTQKVPSSASAAEVPRTSGPPNESYQHFRTTLSINSYVNFNSP